MHISKSKSFNLLSLAEVKEHLRIDANDNTYNGELQRLIKSAILETEKRIGADIVPTVNTLIDYCVRGCYYQIDEPNISIVSVSANTLITGYSIYKFTSYTLLKFNTSIDADTLQIIYTSGMSSIPEDLKSAILIKIGSLFDIDRNGYVQNTIRESKAYDRIITSYTNLNL